MFEIPELFRLNKERQEQGYYLGEFEFKMLGLAYLLDHGEYATSVAKLGRLHDQLETGEGLIPVPAFPDKRQELEFYLSLQDPTTGAFMDPSYPYCMYEGPTGNVLEHLDALARETGQPLRLKYPLRFFDEIATPEKLQSFLDDISRVGWLGAKFPQTSFHVARNHLAYVEDGNVLERNQLYTFSPEWKQALLRWFHEHQDPETGFWGPLSRGSGELLRRDLNNTCTILRSFVGTDGKDLHPAYPLRYRDRLIETILAELSTPMPPDDELAELHEWSLSRVKALKTLLRYLWRDASPEHRARTRELLGAHVRLLFDRYYVAPEGAFSFYPDSARATLDGTGSVAGLYRDLGAFSRPKQERLWPETERVDVDAARIVARIEAADLEPLVTCPGGNSIRLYDPAPTPTSYLANVSWVVYPRKTTTLDAADLVPRLRDWLESTPQSMGNWVSREAVLDPEELADLRTPRVITHNLPVRAANAILERTGELTAIAFDGLQLPRCQVTFRREARADAPPPAPGNSASPPSEPGARTSR